MRTRQAFLQSRRAGFSLVEVLIAIVILAVGMLAVARMFAASISLSARARIMTDAGLAAQSVVEMVRASGCVSTAGDSVAGPIRIRWTGQAADVLRMEVLVSAPAGDSMRTDTVTAFEVCGP